MKSDSKKVERLSKKQLIERGMNVVAGLDLGDKHSFVCLIDLDGKVVERKKLQHVVGGGQALLWRVGGDAGGVGSRGRADWVHRLLERLKHEPLMANTHRLALDHAIAGEGRPNGRRAESVETDYLREFFPQARQ